MVEEELKTKFTADDRELQAAFDRTAQGASRAKREIDKVSGSLEKMELKEIKVLTATVALQMGLRGVSRQLEQAGILSGGFGVALAGVLNTLQLITAALQIYKGVQALANVQTWIAVKAKFAEMAANMGTTTFGVGALVAIGIATAAVVGIAAAVNAQKAQFGAVVMPRPGGTLMQVGEAGEPEAVLPLSRIRDFGMEGGGGVNIQTVNITGVQNRREFMRELGREIELQKGV
jgi:hypothetical protein